MSLKNEPKEKRGKSERKRGKREEGTSH